MLLNYKKGLYQKNALLTSPCFLPETYFSGLLIDYEKVLELDANNLEAKNELKKINQVIRLIGPNINQFTLCLVYICVSFHNKN